MFGRLLEDIAGVVTDTAKVVVAPVAATAAVAREITKPIAEIATEAVDALREEKQK